jgi:aminodeoxyfutalosine deaminase
MIPRLLCADVVLPGDGAAIPDGAVLVDQSGTILDAGLAADLTTRHAGANVERIRGAIMPGLINAHTHVELSALRGKVRPGGGFATWVERMLSARAVELPERNAAEIARAVHDLDRAGTAAVGEVTNTLASVEPLKARGIAGIVFHEVFGLNRKLSLALVSANEAIRVARGPGWPGSDLAYAPAPHTLYTTHPDAVHALVGLARGRGVRTTIHLAEHPAERAFLIAATGPFADVARRRRFGIESYSPCGKGPVDRAADLGLLAPDVILVHLADASDSEIRTIAQSGAPVVVCPRSNEYIEGRSPPIPAMLAAGIMPALGTDSLASNVSLDVIDEARAIAAAYPEISGRVLLEMATWAGARAIGRTDLGRIAKGTAPGIVAVGGDADRADPAAWVIAQPNSRRFWIVRRGATP